MSIVKVQGNASGTGTFTIASPNSNTDRTLTLPDNTGTLVTTGSTAGVSQAMLAAGVAGNGPAFSAFRSSTNQSLTATVWTKLQLQSEEFDTNSNYDNVTNYRFTPTVAGYYKVNGCMETTGAPTYQYMAVYKNGTLFKRSSVGLSPGTSVTVAALIYCNGSTDYLELYVNSQASVAAVADAGVTFFQAFLARSA
jgi:hypothetical protein